MLGVHGGTLNSKRLLFINVTKFLGVIFGAGHAEKTEILGWEGRKIGVFPVKSGCKTSFALLGRFYPSLRHLEHSKGSQTPVKGEKSQFSVKFGYFWTGGLRQRPSGGGGLGFARITGDTASASSTTR